MATELRCPFCGHAEKSHYHKDIPIPGSAKPFPYPMCPACPNGKCSPDPEVMKRHGLSKELIKIVEKYRNQK